MSDQILGIFYVLEYRTKVEARTYTLDIFQESQNEQNPLFELELIISGHFGSLGSTWNGTCILEKEIITFNTEKLIEWKHTFLEEEKYKSSSKIDKSYVGKILIRENDIFLNLSLKHITLKMSKLKIPLNEYTYKIVERIIYDLNLDTEYGKYNDSSKFWSISNLIYRNIKQSPDNQEIELICEYDLDVAEGVNKKPMSHNYLHGHYVAKVLLNNNKDIIGYKSLK
ncbi:MAG: hypothetical protein GF383_03720 [Candidatus Lokiarchaeota archaeon]|nr:hypothetical protein [Candidatus Lokiarchaeota archaeon]MBD3338803.1 hypothetical protein [Candidatus Lokiarchaeota archaeon]